MSDAESMSAGSPPTARGPSTTPLPPAAGASRTAPSPAPPPPDWPAQATDTVVRAVDQVRSRTTRPAVTAARGVVFGLLALVLGVTALVLLSVGVVRLLDVVLPRGVWLVYLVLGVVFCIIGAVFWHRRHAHDPTA